MTQDLGTADVRYQEYHMDRMIYVVANEQDYHFKVLKLCLQKLGKKWAFTTSPTQWSSRLQAASNRVKVKPPMLMI